MRRISLLLFIVITARASLWGQLAGVPPSGPVSLGLGGISSVLENDWAIFNNPAGLNSTNKVTGVFAYQTIFNFAPFNTVSAAINVPTSFGVGSFGAFRFGDELFSSQMASFGFAKKIGIMSLGVKANFLQYNIEGFGKRSVFVAEIGGIANLTPEISFGTHIYNFTQSVIATESQEKVPTIIRLSMDYHPNDQLNLFIEGEKDVDLDPDLKFGLTYRIIEELILRTGFSTVSNKHSFGAGFMVKRFTIDYGLRANQNVGSTHNFGLTFRLSD